MRAGWAQSRRRCGAGEPQSRCRGGRASLVPVQMWHGEPTSQLLSACCASWSRRTSRSSDSCSLARCAAPSALGTVNRMPSGPASSTSPISLRSSALSASLALSSCSFSPSATPSVNFSPSCSALSSAMRCSAERASASARRLNACSFCDSSATASFASCSSRARTFSAATSARTCSAMRSPSATDASSLDAML